MKESINTFDTMKTTIFSVLLAVLAMTTTAQTQPKAHAVHPTSLSPTINLPEPDDSVKAEFTGWFWEVGDTTATRRYYPIYRGSKGGLFVVRTAKESGNQYRQYLGTDTIPVNPERP